MTIASVPPTPNAKATEYAVISADGHLEVPPDDFAKYIPDAFRDRAPRRVQTGDGGDSWLVEGSPLIHTGANLTAGQVIKPRGRSYWNGDGSRAQGAGGAEQRLAEQDLDGVDAEVLFPPIFVKDALAGIADNDAYEAIVRAYNTFVAKEVHDFAPSRLLALGVIPARGVAAAIDELKRCVSLGLPGVALTAFPHGGTTADAEDNAFWEAALDLGMPLTGHTHFGAPYPPFVTGHQQGAHPNAVSLTTRQAFQRPLWTIAQLIVAGTFDRFPELEFYFAETNASWLPNGLHELDENYEAYAHTFERPLAQAPSEYVRNHISFSFIQDSLVVPMIDLLPVDNLMWGSDFPHSVGSFPHSRAWLDDNLRRLPEDVSRKILQDNPTRFFKLSL